MKNSQIFSVDAIIAMSAFILILVSSAWAWDSVRSRIYLSEQRNDMEFVAASAISVLIEKPGDPDNWHKLATFDESSISSLGLTNGVPWVLDTDKAAKLEELSADDSDYVRMKEILGIKGPGYEFFLNITIYENGFGQSYEIGRNPVAAKEVVVLQRTMASERWAKVVFKVWSTQ